MAAIWTRLTSTVSAVSRTCNVMLGYGRLGLLQTAAPLGQQTPVRTRFQDARMRRDFKRRMLIKEHWSERIRLNAVRKNTILPRELQEMADKEVAALPRDSSITRIRDRCVVTSRPRSVQFKWRVSRIVWRHLADYNQLSGVTRASW